MDVIELFICCPAEIILTVDKIFSVNYSAVAEPTGSVAASYYCRNACPLKQFFSAGRGRSQDDGCV